MKNLFGIILLTILMAVTGAAQELHSGNVVRTKNDTTKVWVVERLAYSGYIKGYVLRDSLDYTEWFSIDEIKMLTNEESTKLIATLPFRSDLPFTNLDRFTIGGMKPIGIETIHPHSGLTIFGAVLCLGGVVEFIVAANNHNNSSILTTGIVGGIVSLSSGIGILDVSLQTETYVRYPNGMSIRVDITP